MSKRALLFLFFICSLVAPAQAQQHNHGPTKDGKYNPFVASDARGGFYLAYVERANDINNLMLSHSKDGKDFSAPAQVNNVDGDAMVRNENPPKVAVSPGGDVYVTWSSGPSHGECNIKFARSTDGGKSFSPAVTINSDAAKKPTGHAFQSITLDKKGRIYLSWIDERNKTKEDRGAEIWMSTSDDGGKTFSPDRRILTDVCECCRTGIQTDSAGRLYISYRGVPRTGPMNRDILVARSDDGGKTFIATAVSKDGWEINGCPVAGPGMAIDEQDRIAVVWFMGGGDRPGLYYAFSSDRGQSFSPRRFLDPDQKMGKHAQLTVRGDGKFLVAWSDAGQKTVTRGTLDIKTGALQKSEPHESSAYPVVAANGQVVLTAGMRIATQDIFLHAEPLAGSAQSKSEPTASAPEGAANHEHHAQKPQSDTVNHDHHAQKPAGDAASPQDTPKAGDPHAGHDMSKMAGGNNMMSTVIGGPFKTMSAIGSGTSLMPSTSPGYMYHWMKGDWMLMLHGEIKAGFNHQGGPRGVNKAESQNWLMVMAERPAGKGRLMLRGMISAEPWTAPRRGFPELFQTGETYSGRPIIDAQHPHDLFMELAAAYVHQVSEHVSINLYGGPVAEPALGPVAFMHRMSASENPAAPLSHHWQDSTHITHGVFTAGVTAWRFRVESSIFHGREPDENRKDIEMGKLDSWSARLWYTPTPNWALQFSHGHLNEPETLEPGDLDRTTASISYNKPWQEGNWATSLIWGRNSEAHGDSNAYLLESTANFKDKNYLYTRLELVDKLGLLGENIFGRAGSEDSHEDEGESETGEHFDPSFRVGAFTFGYVRDIVADRRLRVGLGADVTFYHVPGGVKPVYGSSPRSFHLFLRIRPGRMAN